VLERLRRWFASFEHDPSDARKRPRSRTSRRALPAAPDAGLREFLTSFIQTRTGPFSFEHHTALVGICDALADPDIPRIDVLKATQIGLTTLAGFGCGLWEAAVHRRNVGYFLPTNKMARELVGERLRHAAHEDLAERMRVNSSDGIVRAGEGRIYVRGLYSILSALSVPLDVNLYDEVDDLNREHFLWARQRLDGSAYAREIAFACGRHPGEGIDARFQEGTQHHWHLRCRACGKADQVPELLFPENVRRVEDMWRVVCVGCGAPLDVEADGRWVAHYPDRGSTSFRVSALAIPRMRLDRLMREWQAAQTDRRLLAPFRCSKLALPDAADRLALTAEDIGRAVGDYAPTVSAEHSYVGIDTGDWCHLAVAVIADADKICYVNFERMRGEALVERLKTLDRTFHFAGLLIDQRPEGSLARAVCRAFPGVSYLQQFASAEREDTKPLAGESFRVLSFEREETLGAWCDLVRRKPPRLIFPRTVDQTHESSFLESDVARHILTGAQRAESTDRTGHTVYRFRGGAVENHYFMASVFAWRIAGHMCGRQVSAEDIALVGQRVTEEL